MRQDDGEKLIDELRDLIGDGPGPNDAALNRARAIARLFLNDRDVNSITREKVNSLIEYLGIWFSPRKWQQYGDAGQQLRVILRQDIFGLARGLRWPPAGSA